MSSFLHKLQVAIIQKEDFVKTFEKQKAFFERIKQKLPPSQALPQTLSDLLGTSLDSAYRRIRGEKLIDFAELEKICHYFSVQPLELIANTSKSIVSFSYHPHLYSLQEFKQYILKIRDDVTKIKNVEGLSLYISAADLPLFIHFKYKELTQFKFFYWLKSVIGDPDFDNKVFNEAWVDEELVQASIEIYDAYVQLPSVEIWSEQSIDSTIRQIKFYWESGSFESKEQALLITGQVKDLLETVKTMASKNAKRIEGKQIDTSKENYTLYNSDVTIGNNCILLNSDLHSEVYLSHYTYKSIKTNDTEFVSDTKEWLENLIKKSTLISGIAEKQRFQFFKVMEKKINELEAYFD